MLNQMIINIGYGGDNTFWQCTLQNKNKVKIDDMIISPICINNIFYEKTDRKIDQVYLGNNATYIIGKLESAQ